MQRSCASSRPRSRGRCVARRPVRVALVTEIPAPFRTPIFNALAARDDVELLVLFLAAHDPRRSYVVRWGELDFAYEVLPGKQVQRGGRWIVLTHGLVRALRRFGAAGVIVRGREPPGARGGAARAALEGRTPTARG